MRTAQYGSFKRYAVLKTMNTGGFIMIPVPLCLTYFDRRGQSYDFYELTLKATYGIIIII